MREFMAGLTTMGFAIAALFFLRFWRRTGDVLFVIFGIAFVLLALTQALATTLGAGREELGLVYLLRLAAFLLIIGGILHKNFRQE